MTKLSVEKLDRFLAALDVAILVVNEECPTCPEANVEELQALRDLRGEIREAILVRNQSAPTVTSFDDEYRVEPPSEISDRDEHNAFKS